MNQIAKTAIPEFLRQLERKYDIYAPIRSQDGTRVFAKPTSGPLALEGGQLPLGPKFLFFPPSQSLFTFDQLAVNPADSKPTKPILVFGVSSADAAGLSHMDRFFMEEHIDDVYAARREGSVLITYVGETGGAQFEPLAADGFDLQFAALGEEAFVWPGSKVGSALLQEYGRLFEDVEDADAVRQLLESKSAGADRKAEVEEASLLIREGEVPGDFWEWMAMRCISCGGCSYVCPTCTCFDVWDRAKEGSGARLRCWDTCLLAGFTREASGHNPRREQSDRCRRRIEHKLLWDVARWGTITCVACGRCVDACPSTLGTLNIAKEIIRRFGQKEIG